MGILAASVLIGGYLICFWGGNVHYLQCAINKDQFVDIIQTRVETEDLLEALIFDEERLFYDSASKTFYYSLLQGSSSAYNPRVEIKSNYADLQIAFLTDGITEDQIRNNRTADVLAYTEGAYCQYHLQCTTLPMMNIECIGAEYPEGISDDPVSMYMTLFDNQYGSTNRVICSEGRIHIRGGSTRGYVKHGYDVALVQESVGSHLRKNDISLLGMRQDDDWVLYAAYNDQEKIRNVFSCQLWKDSCATDNVRGIDTGVEYRYLELFMNGEYYGLYALGYKIDQKQLQADVSHGREALYKVVTWADSSKIYATEGNGYELRGVDGDWNDWSRLLMEYYDKLAGDTKDNESLYAGIDIDNAIDLYLFLNLMQGEDHVRVNQVKNLYIMIRKEENGELTALYAPWDMDISWGNLWDAEASLFTVPYGISADVNYVMESEYLNQLILNGDEAVWEKIFHKYWQLRTSEWSEDKINAMLDEYEAAIYGSGAYLRDMKRWPDGLYADAADGLGTFRSYVTERLQETDAYYGRLEALCRESIFVRRSAQYKDFMESGFVIEVNDKELLKDADYSALFAYMGIDASSITETVRFIVANPAKRAYHYFSSVEEMEECTETDAGTLTITTVRDGVYIIALDGVECFETTLFSQPAIAMSVMRDREVQQFSFIKGHRFEFSSDPFMKLAVYVEALSATGYHAVIEINNLDIWKDPDYIQLFASLGVPEDSIQQMTDCVVWNGQDKTASVLEDVHVSGGTYDAQIGEISLFENEEGIYGIYMDGEELFVSPETERAAGKIRILLLDPDSHRIVEDILFDT